MTFQREPFNCWPANMGIKTSPLFESPGWCFQTKDAWIIWYMDSILGYLGWPRNWANEQWAREQLILVIGSFLGDEILPSYIGNCFHKPWDQDSGTWTNQYFIWFMSCRRVLHVAIAQNGSFTCGSPTRWAPYPVLKGIITPIDGRKSMGNLGICNPPTELQGGPPIPCITSTWRIIPGLVSS